MDPHGFDESSGLRASDADRDNAAAVINTALAEGRLTAQEHADRLDAIYAAKTHAELAPLLADLPGERAAAPSGATSGQVARSGRGGKIIAIFSGASRKGTWHADPVMDVLAVFGGVELDFRDAVLPGQEVVLRAHAVLGGVEITVPPEMRVVDNGIAILGGREITGNAGDSASPQAPVLRIEGAVVLGGVEVKRRRRKGDKDSGPADDGGQFSRPWAGPADDLLGTVLGTREEIRDQIRERRRQIHEQRREWHREWHRERHGWADRDDD